MTIKNKILDNSYIAVFSVMVIAAIIFSHPFLKLPFDMWEHLTVITSFYDNGKSFIFWPEDVRRSMYLWHLVWGYFFKFIHINDIFVWAKIIHVSQSILSYVCIAFFSSTFVKLALPNIKNVERQMLIIFSIILWFIGNGSAEYDQRAWILWYSITYQGLTIPLYWYISALSMHILFDKCSIRRQKIVALSQIVLILPLLLIIHPTEALFYLISLMVMVCFCRSYVHNIIIAYRWPFVFAISFLSICFVIIILTKSIPVPSLFTDFYATYVLYVDKVKSVGLGRLVMELNAFPKAFSEIAIFSLLAGLFTLWISKKRSIIINQNLFKSQLISSILFFLVPVIPLTFIVAAIITHYQIVWRFYYGSAWFVILPVFVFAILPDKSAVKRHVYMSVSMIGMTATAFVASHYLFYGSLFGNTMSLLNSFGERGKQNNDIQYSSGAMDALKEIIDKNDINVKGKTNIFYIRGDLAPIVRGVFRKYVYSNRTVQFSKASFYPRAEAYKYNLIDIDLPRDFPKDEKSVSYFSLEKR
ncbi:MAG: hypothetical protein ABIE74_12260 [Pseudomonadota bacterium]